MRCESDISVFPSGTRPCILDARFCAEHIVRHGFSIVKVPTDVGGALFRMRNDFPDVVVNDKVLFAFPKRTDGFMPPGTTFARDVEKIDLCETFNYWHAYRHDHAPHLFSKSNFYLDAVKVEAIFNRIALDVLNGISSFLNFDFKWDFRSDSYLQFNIYHDVLRLLERRYLQDAHEDGHVITLVKPNNPGLVVYRDGVECLVNLQDDEAIIMAGSLLTELTDGLIAPAYHAVLNLNLSECRASLIYNVNILGKGVVSMGGKALNMLEIANAHHVAFGQFPYHSE